MAVGERRTWAKRVFADLEPHLARTSCVTFLAGVRYREFLESSLRKRGLQVEVPMEGLGIGKQLAWLNRQLRLS